jgi:hypothetical protein
MLLPFLSLMKEAVYFSEALVSSSQAAKPRIPLLLALSVSLFVRPTAWSNSPLARNLIFEHFSVNLLRISKFHYNLIKTSGTLHEDQHTFLIISR